jgi:hypothetical protein
MKLNFLQFAHFDFKIEINNITAQINSYILLCPSYEYEYALKWI